MGYTHYWSLPESGKSQEEWTRAIMAAARIVSEPSSKVTGYCGTGDCWGTVGHCNPFQDNAISFQSTDGRSETVWLGVRLDDYHAPFHVIDGRNVSRDFCKTNHAGYDTLVTAVLATLEHLAPTCIAVESDGDASDWVIGVVFARLVTGESISFPRALNATADDIAEVERLEALLEPMRPKGR